MSQRYVVVVVVLAVLMPGGSAGQSRAPGSGGPPRPPWGDPDLQGTYTSNGVQGVPMERPKKEVRTMGIKVISLGVPSPGVSTTALPAAATLKFATGVVGPCSLAREALTQGADVAVRRGTRL